MKYLLFAIGTIICLSSCDKSKLLTSDEWLLYQKTSDHVSSRGGRQISIYKKDSTLLVLKFNNDGTLDIVENGELKEFLLWSTSEDGDYLLLSDALLGDTSYKKLKIMKLSKKELILYNKGPNKDFQVKELLSFKRRSDNEWSDKSVDFIKSLNKTARY